MTPSAPWHPGEIAAQKRAGSFEQMQLIGPRAMRDRMPDQHREFFSQLPLIVLGAEDPTGHLWATALFGDPGFIQSPDAVTLLIHSQVNRHDPLADALQAGHDIGLLGIELETRRRNRLNATITAHTTDQIALRVKQSFGNCPKYIQVRQRALNPAYGDFSAIDFTQLNTELAGFIGTSDTFFIASQYRDASRQNNRGIDLSHRGGRPGFIKLSDDRTLLIPDYAGNNFFNTVGNLTVNPQAGLLFPDFRRGDMIHMSGRAEIVWRDSETLPFEGVERMIRFTLQQGRLVTHSLPYLYSGVDYSPFNPAV
ncbi:pyridoxamine 5'-phosphate oxidase family protein [Sedimenticola sp.]|uniref:pyridoxamine 5'-phosphate oxidase family protein n=1 Tax=Sedimenticola sp. TaxID=1940285 RepID=UPI003D0D2EC3